MAGRGMASALTPTPTPTPTHARGMLAMACTGSAYIHGMDHAKGDFIFIMDADLSHHVRARDDAPRAASSAPTPLTHSTRGRALATALTRPPPSPSSSQTLSGRATVRGAANTRGTHMGTARWVRGASARHATASSRKATTTL